MFSKSYKRYVLGTLTLVFSLSSVDLNLMALLGQPIKEEMRLSDSQLGFLTGIAFALFYATLGLPVARWVDRGGNRPLLTSMAIGVWGVTLMACLFVTNFLQLVVARVAAGVGGSGCQPATYSLLGDYFPAPSERMRAMTIYQLAGPLPVLVSFILGGWINENYGWRAAFFMMGIPGLLVAALVKATITEPRLLVNHTRGLERQHPRAADILLMLWQQRSSRHLSIAIIFFFIVGLGMGPWFAAFMMRSHSIGTAALGVWMGLICGIGGIVGVLLGGYVAERWFADNERGQMRLCGAMMVCLVPCYGLLLFLPEKKHALIAFVPLVVAGNFIFGPAFALLQRLVVDEMRAITLAVVMLLANLIGMGIGPQIVGIVSDALMPFVGRDSLRYAMMSMSLVALIAAYHFWRASTTVKQELLVVAHRASLNTAAGGGDVYGRVTAADLQGK